MKKLHKKQGLIKLALILIGLVFLLSFFRIDLQAIAQSETGRSNFKFLWGVSVALFHSFAELWTTYLQDPTIKIALLLWEHVIRPSIGFVASWFE